MVADCDDFCHKQGVDDAGMMKVEQTNSIGLAMASHIAVVVTGETNGADVHVTIVR